MLVLGNIAVTFCPHKTKRSQLGHINNFFHTFADLLLVDSSEFL